MTPVRCTLLLALLFSASFLVAQCTTDNRKNKNSGVLITDFTITGTQTISATDLERITSDMIGSCYDEDSEEMEQRLRAAFQDRGYFQAEVKSLRFKPRDPLGVPKPVALEGEVSEGPQYRLAEVSFVNNHAFPVAKLRQQFRVVSSIAGEGELGHAADGELIGVLPVLRPRQHAKDSLHRFIPRRRKIVAP